MVAAGLWFLVQVLCGEFSMMWISAGAEPRDNWILQYLVALISAETHC